MNTNVDTAVASRIRDAASKLAKDLVSVEKKKGRCDVTMIDIILRALENGLLSESCVRGLVGDDKKRVAANTLEVLELFGVVTFDKDDKPEKKEGFDAVRQSLNRVKSLVIVSIGVMAAGMTSNGNFAIPAKLLLTKDELKTKDIDDAFEYKLGSPTTSVHHMPMNEAAKRADATIGNARASRGTKSRAFPAVTVDSALDCLNAAFAKGIELKDERLAKTQLLLIQVLGALDALNSDGSLDAGQVEVQMIAAATAAGIKND